MSYRERVTAVRDIVLWERGPRRGVARDRILPDGCLDLIWDGRRLFVAGPDATARWHESPPDAAYAALRIARGLGPALVGVPADELVNRTPDLDELWPAGSARRLTEQVAEDPVPRLLTWARERAAAARADPLGPLVHALAAEGATADGTARRLGMSPRQLHRHMLPLFGYGPKRLARILRLQRALARAEVGETLARVAASCGYADQAHLTREVRALTGTTPAALLRERRGPGPS